MLRMSEPTLKQGSARQPQALIGTISSDAHTWNLVFLQLFLEEHGYQVTHAGACSSPDTVLQIGRSCCADLVVMSTVNGHGSIEAAAYARRLRQTSDLARVPIVLGGKLRTDGRDHLEVDSMRAAGYDAVFIGPSALQAFQSYLAELPSSSGADRLDAPCA
jgi:methylaspartate mutase sigma subunit